MSCTHGVENSSVSGTDGSEVVKAISSSGAESEEEGDSDDDEDEDISDTDQEGADEDNTQPKARLSRSVFLETTTSKATVQPGERLDSPVPAKMPMIELVVDSQVRADGMPPSSGAIAPRKLEETALTRVAQAGRAVILGFPLPAAEEEYRQQQVVGLWATGTGRCLQAAGFLALAWGRSEDWVTSACFATSLTSVALWRRGCRSIPMDGRSVRSLILEICSGLGHLNLHLILVSGLGTVLPKSGTTDNLFGLSGLCMSGALAVAWYWLKPLRTGPDCLQFVLLAIMSMHELGLLVMQRTIVRGMVYAAAWFIADLMRRQSFLAAYKAATGREVHESKGLRSASNGSMQKPSGFTMEQAMAADKQQPLSDPTGSSWEVAAGLQPPGHGPEGFRSCEDLAAALLLQKPAWQPRRRVVRMCLKIWDHEPEQLTTSWQSSLDQYLQQEAGCKLRAAYVQRGCTQIIAELEVLEGQVPHLQLHTSTQQRQAWQLAQPGHVWIMEHLFGQQQGDDAGSKTAHLPITMQVPNDFLPHLRGPPVVCNIPPAIVSITPAAAAMPSASVQQQQAVMVAGNSRVVLQLQLAAPLPQGVAPMARMRGSFLHVQLLGGGGSGNAAEVHEVHTPPRGQSARLPAATPGKEADARAALTSLSCITPLAAGACGLQTLNVELQLPSEPGLLHMELHDWSSGALGGSSQLLLLSSEAAVEEICQQLHKTNSSGASELPHLNAFMLDLGRWLEAADVSSDDVTSAALAGDAQVDVLQVGSQLLRFCLESGMPSCVAMIAGILVRRHEVSPSALLHSVDPQHWLQTGNTQPVGSSTSLTPLHLAVASGSVDVVAGVVAWAHSQGFTPDWSVAGPSGLTPLHLAALLPASGDLVRSIFELCGHSAASAWLHTAAGDGMSPQHYATRRGLLALNQLAKGMRAAPAHSRAAMLHLRDPEPSAAAAGSSDYQIAAEYPGISNDVQALEPVQRVERAVDTAQSRPALGIPMIIAVLLHTVGASCCLVLQLLEHEKDTSSVHFNTYLALYALWTWPYIGYLLLVKTNAWRMVPCGGISEWLLLRNPGLLLHLNRLGVMVVVVRVYDAVWIPRPFIIESPGQLAAKMLGIAMTAALETYDLRAASAVAFFAHFPAWYMMLSAQKSSHAVAYALVNAAVIFATHSTMTLLRSSSFAKNAAAKAKASSKLAEGLPEKPRHLAGHLFSLQKRAVPDASASSMCTQASAGAPNRQSQAPPEAAGSRLRGLGGAAPVMAATPRVISTLWICLQLANAAFYTLYRLFTARGEAPSLDAGFMHPSACLAAFLLWGWPYMAYLLLLKTKAWHKLPRGGFPEWLLRENPGLLIHLNRLLAMSILPHTVLVTSNSGYLGQLAQMMTGVVFESYDLRAALASSVLVHGPVWYMLYCQQGLERPLYHAVGTTAAYFATQALVAGVRSLQHRQRCSIAQQPEPCNMDSLMGNVAAAKPSTHRAAPAGIHSSN